MTAASWASYKLQAERGVSWRREVLTRPEMEAHERRLALTVQMPPTSDYWDALADLDSELVNDYWNHMQALRVPSPDTARATEELMARGRPWTAIDLIAGELHAAPQEDETRSLTPEIAQSALDAAMRTESSERLRQNLGYEVGVILDYLERSKVDTAQLASYEFVFFRVLEHHRSPRALSATLSKDPSLFVDMISRVYRGKNEAPRQLGQADQRLAQHAWWVLAHWKAIPGGRDDGTVDGAHLKQWVADARLAFADRDRADIGDEQIGQVLSQSPPGTDDIWPAEPVREIVETIGSTSVEAGLHTGVINNRGITARCASSTAAKSATGSRPVTDTGQGGPLAIGPGLPEFSDDSLNRTNGKRSERMLAPRSAPTRSNHTRALGAVWAGQATRGPPG